LSNSFTGTFDGLGHRIDGLVINRPGEDYVGLFGSTSNATLRNVGLIGGSVSGYRYVGGLVGEQRGGSIEHAYGLGSVERTGNNDAGWLGGQHGDGSIEHAYATGSVEGTGYFVGGLVGYQDAGNISHSIYATTDGEGNTINNAGDYS